MSSKKIPNYFGLHFLIQKCIGLEMKPSDLFRVFLYNFFKSDPKPALSQKDVATKAGVQYKQLNSFINNKQPLGEDARAEVARALGMHYEECLAVGRRLIDGDAEAGTHGQKIADDDTQTSNLVKMTAEVLKSETEYSVSLAANIRSFYNSVQMQREREQQKCEIAELRNIVQQVAKEMTNGGSNCCLTDRRKIDAPPPSGNERRKGVDRRKRSGHEVNKNE